MLGRCELQFTNQWFFIFKYIHLRVLIRDEINKTKTSYNIWIMHSYKSCIIVLAIFVAIKIILYNEIIQNRIQNQVVNCCTILVPIKIIQYNKIIQNRKQSGTWSTNGITSSTYIDKAVTRWTETCHCIPSYKI
jgi:hypothetical protein